MSSHPVNALSASIESAAATAGLAILSSEQGADFHGQPTSLFRLRPISGADGQQTLQLELSETFDCDRPDLQSELRTYFQQEHQRLANPSPDVYVTLGGMPIVFSEFRWPFHRSVSGADTYIVHGLVRLADGGDSKLHAKISASMTVTFADSLTAPEQPFAETFIYNAIRKTLDQGQLEMLKSGNRQPVPITTRYYSRWQKKFLFTDTTDESRRQFVLTKVFWLSGVLGNGKPVWLADPRDAQYLNTTVEELTRLSSELARDGLLASAGSGEFAAATPALMERNAEFRERLQQALAFTKPTFNEEMRAGHTNM